MHKVYLILSLLVLIVLSGCGDHQSDRDAPNLTLAPLFDQTANPSGVNRLFVIDGNLNLSGTVEAGAEMEIEINNGDARPVTVVGETWSYLLLNEDLEEEINTILITAKDDAENQTSINFNVTKDTIGPEVTLDQFITPEPTGTQTLAGTIEAGSRVLVAVDDGPEEMALVSGGGWTYNLIGVAPGSYTVTAVGIDALGNESETNAVAVIEVEPAATVLTIDPVPATTGETVSLAGTRSANAPLVFTPIETGGDISNVDLSVPESWSATFSDLDSGFNLLAITTGTDPIEAEARILVNRDRSGPLIVANTPAHGAVASPDSPITVTFDEDVDETVLLDPNTKAIILKDASDAEIGGAVTYNTATWTAVFTPDAALTSGEAFTVTVDADVKDVLGNRLGSGYSWMFTTTNP